MPKQDSFSWWQDRIDVLHGYEKEAVELYKKTGRAYEVGPQAICKLALFAYYVKVYSTIIKKRFPKAYYLDLFAGCGLTKIKTTNDVVLGSALLAHRVPSEGKKFDRMILVERDPEFANALKMLLPEADVINKDVNSLDWCDVLGSHANNIPILVLADPEGMDVAWATLEPLLGRWSDVIINYQVEGPRRTGGRVWNSPMYEKTLTRFYGTTDWKTLGRYTEDEFLNLYVRQIKKYKDIVIPTKVKGHRGFIYYMIVAVRKTRGDQGWINAVERARLHIESAGADLIERLLDVYTKRAPSLDSWTVQKD